MTAMLEIGRYRVRIAESAADKLACQRLRHLSFRGRPGIDADRHDAAARHVMILSQDALVGTFRVFTMAGGARIADGYAAGRYDLSRLAAYPRPILELGRFCTDPKGEEGDVLRLAWGALARLADSEKAGLLIGCTSFRGTDPAPYADALGYLAEKRAAPAAMAPGRLSARTLPLARGHEPRRALQQMPPLLRSYLGLGAWFGDHAVIDTELDTIHVFTGLEVDRIPPRRARSLRAILDPASRMALG